MRLICTIPADTPQYAYEFSYYLQNLGILNECEVVLNVKGEPTAYHIWIQNEEDVERSITLYKEFQENPSEERFQGHYEAALQKASEIESSQLLENDNDSTALLQKKAAPAPYGKISITILFAAILFFVWSQFQRPNVPNKLPGVPDGLNAAPIEKMMLYDYPLYFEIRDEILSNYSAEELKNKASPPALVKPLLQKLKKTPYWNGIYDRIIDSAHSNQPVSLSGPFFEKIREGQIWRLFTPILLHLDLLHIFFNILWFILLGNQIEYKIGSIRYLFLIIIVALISNTAQYLMSGPFFMGLSGVITGFAGFIWARQRKAPWEGYLVNRMTLLFLAVFVFGMFLLQLLFFALEFFGNYSLIIGIANTAHIVGALVGYLLGSLNLFSIRSKKTI